MSAADVEETTDDLAALEDYAHERKVLLSSDAMRFFRAHRGDGNEYEALDSIIANAKASYPSEDGWIVVNLDRIASLMSSHEETADDSAASEAPVVIGGGSLAEAIVTGNVAAALRLIERRPMVALAEAAAELDAAYRLVQGAPVSNVVVSETLRTETSKRSVEHLKGAIDALTSALDGTYTNEASAVKMAVMKAASIFSL